MSIMNVIGELYNQIDYGLYNSCKDRFYNAENCIECCSNPYFEQTQISYACPQKRKIYVARYAPTHISEIIEALSKTPRDLIKDLFNKKVLTVASIGGGPGTDIAAFNSWLFQNSNYVETFNLKKVRYVRIDIHEQWNDISTKLIHLNRSEEIEYKFYKEIFDVSTESIKPDLHDCFDVIMLSYIFSEINENMIADFARNVFQMVSEKTLIIVNDRVESKVEDKINRFFSNIGIDATYHKYKTSGHCGFFYPDDLRDEIHPKLSKNSVIYNVLVQK